MKYENGGNSHYSIINEMNYKHNNSNQLESIKHRCKNILKQYLDIIHKLKREIDYCKDIKIIYQVKSYIRTSKGLIYVAKMNYKGELELL